MNMKKIRLLKTGILVAGLVLSLTQWASPIPPPPPPLIYSPTPADYSVNMPTNTQPSWIAYGFLSLNVYFGITNPPQFVANVQPTGSLQSYNPGSLANGTQYYWRIDGVTYSGAVYTGPVWTFATVAFINPGGTGGGGTITDPGTGGSGGTDGTGGTGGTDGSSGDESEPTAGSSGNTKDAAMQFRRCGLLGPEVLVLFGLLMLIRKRKNIKAS
jgi:hypothetical protein